MLVADRLKSTQSKMLSNKLLSSQYNRQPQR